MNDLLISRKESLGPYDPQSRVIKHLLIHTRNTEAGPIPEPIATKLVTFFNQRMASATCQSYTNALKRLDTWLQIQTKTPRDPRDKLPKAKKAAQRTTRPTDQEASRIIAAASPPLRLAILLVAEMGLRTNEAIHIAPANRNERTGEITYTKKGGQPETVQVSSDVIKLLALAPDTGEPLTPYCERLAAPRHFTNAACWSQYRALKKKLGIRAEIRIHDFRRRLATKAYERTKDLRAAQALLHHDRLASTLNYIAPFDKRKLGPLIEALKPTTRTIQ